MPKIKARPSNLVQMLDRLNVVLAPAEHIVDTSDHQHAAEHDYAPVHVCHGCGVDDREE